MKLIPKQSLGPYVLYETTVGDLDSSFEIDNDMTYPEWGHSSYESDLHGIDLTFEFERLTSITAMRSAVHNGTELIGRTESEIRCLIGLPDETDVYEVLGEPRTSWFFKQLDLFVYFENDVVSDVVVNKFDHVDRDLPWIPRKSFDRVQFGIPQEEMEDLDEWHWDDYWELKWFSVEALTSDGKVFAICAYGPCSSCKMPNGFEIMRAHVDDVKEQIPDLREIPEPPNKFYEMFDISRYFISDAYAIWFRADYDHVFAVEVAADSADFYL